VENFFYHSAIEWFPKYKVRYIDAIIITHYHFDSIGGLDDIRDWTGHLMNGLPLPVYCTSTDYEDISSKFPYLTDTSKATGSFFVPLLEWKIFKIDNQFNVCGMVFTPLVVEHGIDFNSLGFRFENIVYISDVSRISQETMKLLKKDDGDQLDIFIVDALSHSKEHPSHFWFPRTIDLIFQLQPKKSYLIGIY